MQIETLDVINRQNQRRILIFENNKYVGKAIESLKPNSIDDLFIIKTVDSACELFYQLAVNDDIDSIYISYHPVWSQTLHVIYKLKRFYPEIKVVALLDHPHVSLVHLLRGYRVRIIFSKKDSLDCFASTLEMPTNADYLSPSLVEQMKSDLAAKRGSGHKISTSLTSAECFILAEIFGEKSILHIAKERGCSVKTVYQHKNNALFKLGIKHFCEFLQQKKRITE